MEKKTIYTKLLEAQKKFDVATKDSSNPFYKSNYADLNQVWSACKDVLHEQGLFVSQQLRVLPETGKQTLVTKIYDGEGESVESEILVMVKEPNNPQALGSGITYARRYSLSAILGLMSEEDDDGNAATGKSKKSSEGNNRSNFTPEMKQTDWNNAKPSRKQLEAVMAIMKSKGEEIVPEELRGMSKKECSEYIAKHGSGSYYKNKSN